MAWQEKNIKNSSVVQRIIPRGSAAAGFTLIEILVVLAIMAVISSVLIADYRTGQKKYSLDAAAQNIVSDLRRVQSMAMSGTTKTAEIIYDYGIHFDANTSYYTIFADKQANSQRYSNATADVMIERVNLENQVKVVAVSPNSSGLDVVFEPPNPKTYINKNSSGPATITLQYGNDTSRTKTITITLAGAIKTN